MFLEIMDWLSLIIFDLGRKEVLKFFGKFLILLWEEFILEKEIFIIGI